MQKRKLQSYLYEFMNYKYLNISKINEFKQDFIDAVKEKKGKNELKKFVELYFSDENIKKFFNEHGKEFFSFIDSSEYNNLFDLIDKFEKKAGIIFRYYQYLAILYSFLVFKITQNKDKQEQFLEEYKEYLKSYDIDADEIKEFDLRRLNYWMATGSGKTYLMYFMVELYLNLFGNISNIFLILPKGLIYQHIQVLKKIFNADLMSIKGDKKEKDEGNEFTGTISIDWFDKGGKLTKKDVVINILSTNKLVTSFKKREFSEMMENVVYIFDEGHKGAVSQQEGKIEDIKNGFLKSKTSFLFDWSATFQEVFKRELELNKSNKLKINTLNKYFTSSIYNYNLTFFQSDGFGKYICAKFGSEDKDEKDPTKANLKEAMKKFFIQIDKYNSNEVVKYKDEVKYYKPLFLGVSHEIGKSSSKKKKEEDSGKNLIKVLKCFFELIREDEDFKNRFKLESNEELGGKVKLEVGKEEILMRMGEFNGLIYVGSDGINKIMKEFENEKTISQFVNIEQLKQEGIFKKIDERPDILFLFGSKKFIEGWDSKRPSTLFILKGAGASTVQAVQFLGRGLRLEGYQGDGFRHLSFGRKLEYDEIENDEAELEKLYLHGQDVDALEEFLTALQETNIKIIKFYQTKPLEGLNNLKLPYLKYVETDKKENGKYKIITIKLSEDNIVKTKDKLFVKLEHEGKEVKINISESYKKKREIFESEGGKSVKYKTEKGMKNFTIPYLVLKNDIKDVINELNHKNNGVFIIDDSFFINLFRYLTFSENVGLTRQQKKKFIVNTIKAILDRIYKKLNKEITYEIDYIKEDDEDVKFNYEVIVSVEPEKEIIKFKDKEKEIVKVFEMKLKDNVKNDFIIEIRNKDDLYKYFEIDKENPLQEIFFKRLLEQIGCDDYNYLYQRIYHVFNIDSQGNKHDYGNLTVNIDDKLNKKVEFKPSSIIKLNNLEAKVIDRLIEKIKEVKDKNGDKKYKEIYIFRNPNSGDKCFEYISRDDGTIHKFYPDFIFWLIDNNGDKTILYVETKGGTDIHLNEKEQVFEKLNDLFIGKDEEVLKEAEVLNELLEKLEMNFTKIKKKEKIDNEGMNIDIEKLNLEENKIKTIFGVIIKDK